MKRLAKYDKMLQQDQIQRAVEALEKSHQGYKHLSIETLEMIIAVYVVKHNPPLQPSLGDRYNKDECERIKRLVAQEALAKLDEETSESA